ncbi:MAG TPA: glucoamylase family protein [Bacteroidales bacterium]|nr:glucoamylase family protein [Bacteroidales bacterium]
MKLTSAICAFLLLTASAAGKTPNLELKGEAWPAHVELTWQNPDRKVMDIYRSTNGHSFIKIASTQQNSWMDFPGLKPGSEVSYRVRSNKTVGNLKIALASDQKDILLDMVQRYTTRYFSDFGEPTTGMARERSNDTNGDIVTTGGTGFGVMALVAAANRGYVTRQAAYSQISKIIGFLETTERFHGAWAHWYDAKTGKPFSFSKFDDGGDLVETAFLTQGLLTARAYFKNGNEQEISVSNRITKLWESIEWNWYTQGKDSLFWHWSKNYGFKMNHPIKGYDETLITYILAASSPTFAITDSVYEKCYKHSTYYYNGKSYYGIKLSLGMEYGGPLFFTHYSYLGLDPRGLQDSYTNYFERNKAHALIHLAYAMDNPKKHAGLGANCWGFTSSDDALVGYTSHHPGTNDENGTVSPTAAISSIVYTPEASIAALRHFYFDEGKELFGKYGFYDAFNPSLDASKRVVKSYLAIDQGPIADMIENYRSGLLWQLFMSNPEISIGLQKLGFSYVNN